MKRAWRPVAAALLGLLLALAAGEALLRLLHVPPELVGAGYHRDGDGRPVSAAEARDRGLIVPVTPAAEEPLWTFAPGTRFYLCYSDYHQPWFDDRGCVEVRFSSHGIREREEIGFDKPPGQKRILCLGDSFTFGWGVRVEDCWVRLVEDRLRPELGDVVTVNCGAAGTLRIDEYWWGLRDRFHRFQPDMVAVSICLNDLIMTNGSVVQARQPPPKTGLLLIDVLRRSLSGNLLDLDPEIDWVDRLIDLPADHPYFAIPGSGADRMWASGTPQQALRDIRNWCAQRELPFAVILWPYLQGLGNGRYPFRKLHEMVAELCEEEGIPLLDLLPVLEGHRTEELWVTPADLHVNPRGHRLAADPIADFLRAESGW